MSLICKFLNTGDNDDVIFIWEVIALNDCLPKLFLKYFVSGEKCLDPDEWCVGCAFKIETYVYKLVRTSVSYDLLCLA